MIPVSRRTALLLTLGLALSTVAARAQPSATASAKPTTGATGAAVPASDTQKTPSATQSALCDAETNGQMQTFYLKNAVQPSDANEIVTAIRNIENPCTKVYLVGNQSAIVMRASPAGIDLAQRLLADLDRPKKTYRLTYTVSEVDGTKLVGTQHYSMVVVSGQQTQLKQGSKVPIASVSFGPSNAIPTSPNVQTQFTYLDIGMNFTITIDDFANGLRLNTQVEQSSLAPEVSRVGSQDPIVRQTSLRSTAFLSAGKPLMLGSVDIPGTVRHLDIEVIMDQLP